MRRDPSQRLDQGGFTLVELMIVVVIVGVLLLIALPGYQEHVRRGHRAAAQAEMLDIANRQQQFLLANRTYMDVTTLEANGYTLPGEVSAHYTYAIALGTAVIPSYTMTFTATGNQVKDGNLTIDNAGVKLPTNKWN